MNCGWFCSWYGADGLCGKYKNVLVDFSNKGDSFSNVRYESLYNSLMHQYSLSRLSVLIEGRLYALVEEYLINPSMSRGMLVGEQSVRSLPLEAPGLMFYG